jgi:PAS domain S-box-containing protein
MMRKVMREGGQLINRGQESAPRMELRPFGDKQRPAASLMFVPVRSSGTAVGILSIQSYTPAAYGPDDLKLLQSLADLCGDALERIKLTEALREAETKYRSIFENATEGIFQTTPEGTYLSANAALAHMFGFQSPAELIAGVTDIERQFYVRPEARNELRRLLDSQVGVHGFETECYRKDGSTFWMSASGRAVRDESGAVVYYEGTARDITRRKEALKALNDSERKLRLIAENTTDVIFAFDMNRQPLYINPAVEQLTGYTFAEIQAQKFINWIHPEDQERMLRHWEELYTGKAHSEVEFRLITRSGETKWCSSTWGPIRDEAGRQIGVQGREHDITELKRAETQQAALSQLGHRLSAAADPSQAARIIFEVAGELFSWDAGYLHLYSAKTGEITRVLTLDAIEGRRVSVPPAAQSSEPSPMMRKVMRDGGQLINRGQESAPLMELRPFGDKQRRAASLMFVPVRSGGAAVGIFSLQSYTPMAYARDDLKVLQALADQCGDALERIKLTEALKEAEAKYRSIFENATEGIFQTTPAGRYLSANPALAHMFGYQSPEELMASVTDIGRRTYVEPAKREELKRLLAEQGAAEGFEAERYRKDGSVFWISVDAHSVRDGSGRVLYYEGTNRDITEIVRARQALARSKGELERRVRERTAELEVVNQTLRREMADRQRLERQVLESVEREQQRIGRDLHDGLCQLLAGIKFKAAALRARLRRKRLPEAATFEDIEDLIDQTIRQGYGLARGLNPVNLPTHDVSLALKELAASVEAAFGVHCVCNFQSPVTIGEQTVANHLYRIAQEAIHNAIKHGKAREIAITLTGQAGQVALAIQDNGMGLPAPAERKAGMGLQNMKARAGMMGAALEIRAGASGGTVVTCVLTIPNAGTRTG